MNKSKTLFWIYFVLFFFINTYIYFSLLNNFLPYVSNFTNVVILFFLVILVIPFTAFVAESITKFSLRSGLNKRKNFTLFVTGIVFVTVAIASFQTYDNYREKNLNEVIEFDKNKWEYIIVGHDLRLEKQEHQAFAESFQALFEQYTVKKIPDREWDPDVSKENGFNFTAYYGDKTITVSIFENRVSSIDKGYFEIIDGPMNMNWLDKLYDEGIGEQLTSNK